MTQFQKGYVVTDSEGKKHVFDTQADAKDFLRNPLVLKALKGLVKDNDTAAWLMNEKDGILAALESGKVRRVTKAERKELEKALDNVKSGFLHDHAQAILDSFKWPAVARPKGETEEAKAAAQEAEIIQSLMGLTEDDEKMAKWISEHADALRMAYDTGKEVREVSEKAKAAISDWHKLTPEQKQAHIKEKAAKAAAEKAAKAAAAK